MKSHKPDPYCAFKDDLQRYRALRSRDLCRLGAHLILGAVAVITVLYGSADQLAPLLRWLRSLA